MAGIFQTMRRQGRQRNRQAQVEALVQVLLEPLGRAQRRALLGLLDGARRL